MLAGILRFEWRYQTRRAGFIAAVVAFALGAVALVGTGYGPDGVNVNSPYVVMQSLGLLSLFTVFALTLFCANAALRDVEHGMTEIVFSTPIGKSAYLGGRFGGALLAATTVMLITALVLMIAPLVMHVDPARIGAVRPMAYLWALLVIVLPNVVLVGALLFAIATLTRSALATYVGGVAIYALYWVCALLIDSPLMAGAAPTPEGLARAAIVDPFGLSAFFEQTRYWTPSERDARMVAFTGHLLLNRVLWLGIAFAVLAVVYARFTFRVGSSTSTSRRRAARRRTQRTEIGQAPPASAYGAVAPSSGAHAFWPALRSATRLELRHVLRGWIFVALLLLWAFVVGMEAIGDLSAEYGTHVFPTTGLMLDAISQPLMLLGTITLVYYAAEVAWRERLVGIAPLVDVTPAPSAVFYLSKAVALCAMPVVLTLVAIVVAIGVQLAHGYVHIQPALYLTLLWFACVPLALFVIAALALQAISSNRWIGMLTALALALVAYRGDAIGLEHPMLHFGTGPSSAYSDMDGFGGVSASFVAFMAYWTAAAALLACVSWGVWQRGIDEGMWSRLSTLPRRWGRTGTRITVVCGALFAIVGMALFYETSIVHEWEGRDTRIAWSADYERAYRAMASRPEPSIVAVRANVELYPERRHADVAGSYVLENRTPYPIDTAWVSMPRDIDRSSVAIPGATLVRDDARFGVSVFAFREPLAPGGRSEMMFTTSIDRGGIRATPPENDVTGNGTYLTNGAAFPVFGYHDGYELSDPAERRAAGLRGAASQIPQLAAVDSLRHVNGDAWLNHAWTTMDMTVSTSSDQTAIAPGELVRAWESGGRRHFHYVLMQPATPVFGVVSARYAVRRVRHGDVNVELWYHPQHAANVDRILAAATRSLDVLEPRYGAYAHHTLRIAEVPKWGGFGGFAMPGLIVFTEDRGFLSDLHPGDVDLVTRRVAHEVAHQWWGHTLDPADVTGALLMVETLAKHSEQLVVADAQGERAVPRMVAFDEDRYLTGRAQDPEPEPPLLELGGQEYLYYGKGAVVMNALRNLLGGAQVDHALAALLAAHGGARGAATNAATSLDMRDALLDEAKSALDSTLVNEWLGDRTVYDLRVDTATVRSTGAGRFRLTAHVTATKTARRGAADIARSMDGEAIDVAVLDGDPTTGRILYAGKHRVVNGAIDVALDVALDLTSAPAYIVVDPYVRRIDRDRTNNQKRVMAVQ